MYRLFLTLGALAMLGTSVAAQEVILLTPLNAAENRYWDSVPTGIQHKPSGVVCPTMLETTTMPLTEIQIYRADGRDVACHYRVGSEAILSIFVTDTGRYSFEAIIESANASVAKAKGLQRLEPGSAQCNAVLNQVIAREPRATRNATPADCALFGSSSIHAAMALSFAGNWAIKIRHTRAGAPDEQKMIALVIGTIDALQDARRTHFAANQ